MGRDLTQLRASGLEETEGLRQNVARLYVLPLLSVSWQQNLRAPAVLLHVLCHFPFLASSTLGQSHLGAPVPHGNRAPI